MMKKILACFLLLLGIGFLITTPNVYASENTEETQFEQKTYSYTAEDGTILEIILISEKEATLKMGEESYTYPYKDLGEGKIKIEDLEEDKTIYFQLNDEDQSITYLEKNATIVIETVKGGEIVTEYVDGIAGEVVTLYYKEHLFYTVENIFVNGVKLEADEEGNYSFILVEGENIITSSFYVDNEKVKEVAEIIEQFRNKDWKNLFTVENLFELLTWILTTFCSGGFFITLTKMKKIKSMTISDLNKGVNDNVNSNVSNAINSMLTNTLTPILKDIATSIADIKNVTQVLTRCTILQQENTPESRLAILKELEGIQKNQDDLAKKVKDIIDQEINKNNLLETERNNSIEELKKEINNTEEPHL